MDIKHLAGSRLGNYAIESLLGEGGMGVVYKARQISLNRPVALKILAPTLSSDSSFVKRFQREAEAIARLHHVNIVQIYDIGEDQNLHFFSMEYVEGQTLAEVCEREGKINVDEAVRIISQAARALEHAHLNGIIHRDIKPTNIILSKENTVKVMDFGLARLQGQTRVTKESTIMGTVDYMSPEQARGDLAIDHRTDIWSLGVVLFEMLASKAPFHAANESALIHKIIYEEPLDAMALNPEIPPGLAIVLARAMAKDRDRRYDSISEFLRDILSFKTLHLEKHLPGSEYRRTKALDMRATAKERVESIFPERTPFVGRKKEWSTLLRLLAQAAFGSGNLVMIGGEPGVGKTRLTEELLTEAISQGFLCLVGHCYEMQGVQPYMPIVEIIESAARIVEPGAFLRTLGESAPEVAKLAPELRRKFPNIPAAAELPPEQEQRHTFNSITKYLERASQAQPLLLVLEDLHWAGESTMLMVQHIAQQLDTLSVLAVGTYRDTELAVSRPLAKVMEDLLRGHLAVDIILGRLPQADVAEMLKKLTDRKPPSSLVKLIFGQTEGNPFFVEEILKHLTHREKLFDREGRWRTDLSIEDADVPRGVRLVLGHRLQRLSKPCLETLTAAATIGRVAESELLEEMMSLDEGAFLDSLEEAERAGLIRSTSKAGGVKFAFSHEQIRQTLLSDISGLRQQRLHFQVARAMEKLYADALNERAAKLAYHLKKAGASADLQKTCHYLHLAGDNAYDMGASAEAAEFYTEALSFDAPDRAHAEIRYKLGLALSCLGRVDEALDEWRKALSIFEELNEPELIGDVCSEISRSLLWGSRPQEAFEIVNRGLTALGESVNASRCLLLAASGHVLGYLPEHGYEKPNSLFEQARKMAETLGERELEGHILYRKAMFHRSYWQDPEVVTCALRSAELLRKRGKPFDIAEALLAAEWGLLHVGRLEEAAAIERELETFAPKPGAEFNRCMLDIYQYLRSIMVEGDLERSEAQISNALDDCIELQWDWIYLDYLCLGTAQFWRGNWERAEETFRKAATLVGQLLIIHAYMGKKDDALEVMTAIKNFLPLPTQPNPTAAWALLAAAVEALAMLEHYDEVAELYPLAQEAIATGNLVQPLCSGLVQTTAGIAAAAGKLWDQAHEHFETALRQAHEIPHVIEQPEVRRWYACMLINRGGRDDLDKARKLLKEALELYEKIKMPKHFGIAQRLMQRNDSLKGA